MMAEKYKVLVADDEYWIRQNIQAMIDWEENSIDFLEMAVDGEDALKKIEANVPDIFITDINMPFISGIELMGIIKTKYPSIKVIVLSGYSEFEYARQALVYGAVDYLLKPIAKEDLVKVIEKTITIIEENRILEREKEKTRSILLDKEFSELMDNKKYIYSNNELSVISSNIWLDFQGYFLSVIKTERLGKILKKLDISDTNTNQLMMQIKKLITEQTDYKKSLVFNNIFVQNEFIVLTDMSKPDLNKVSDKIIRTIKQYTGHEVSIAISRYYSSLDDLSAAYNDALLALMMRKFCVGSYKIDIEEAENLSVSLHITSEQENQLIFAVQNKNKKLINKVLYEEMEIQKLDNGRVSFMEVKQIVNKIAWIVSNNSLTENHPTQVLAIDNLIELLNMNLENFSMDDVCNVIDQIVDECLDVNESTASPESVRHTVKQVEKYINENYFEELSLASLASTFLISKSYLSKAFKEETGVNVMLYIAKKRIEKSLKYMKQNDLSLTEISSLVGYDDYAYFNRVFRKIMGKGPREYKSTFLKLS